VPVNPLLDVRAIQVAYGGFMALNAVSYRVEPESVVCLLGGNASGKSTSMKAIFGAVPLRSGQIYFKNTRIDRKPTMFRVRLGLAAVPEGRRLFARMSVYENIVLGAASRGDSGQDLKADIEAAYEIFPSIVAMRDRLAGTLSGGEQQMVAIARALVARPALICMDEPSMGLAPSLVKQSFQVIRGLRQKGTAVFVVEQNANVALEVADYAYVLQQGEVVLEGSSSYVAAHPMMKEAYLGKAARGRPSEDSDVQA
jgi:branched-chain amino acid transport system ATP-binding protein